MDKAELNWVAYLIGKIGEDELLPENHERLAEHKRKRQSQPWLKPVEDVIVSTNYEDMES